MSNDIQIFDNPEFGQIRTIEKNNMTWFVGKDIATVLGYTDTFGALKKHVDNDDKQNCQNDSFESPRGLTIINESGLYSLVLSSKLPKAKAFKHWVTAEVLPNIRKTGSYQMSEVKLEKRPSYKSRLIATAVHDMGATANEFVKVFGCKKSMALNIAVPMIGKIYGFDPSPIMQLVPAETNPASLTATDVAKEVGFFFSTGKPNAAKVNKLLASAGLQEKQGKEWKLTDEGKAYGEARPYTRNGHSAYQIYWQPDVIDCLNQFIEPQTAKVISLDELREQHEDA